MSKIAGSCPGLETMGLTIRKAPQREGAKKAYRNTKMRKLCPLEINVFGRPMLKQASISW
jgi:hypothetical protein